MAVGLAGVFLLVFLGILLIGEDNYQGGFDLAEGNNNQQNMRQGKDLEKVRHPAVAGIFYPADPERLSNVIDGFLDSAEAESEADYFKKHPRILLAPHAGYEYSGLTAAYGYKLLIGAGIRRVVLLGSSHNYPVSGIISNDSDSWETPLGKVELDKDAIKEMQITVNREIFTSEHSLEVQLPFLQKVLPADFKIIPVLVGEMDSEQLRDLASVLVKNIDEQTIVVVSSDMSHYPSYEDANKYDRETIKSILTGNPDNFSDVIAKLGQKNIPNAATFMCAEPAMKLALTVAKKLNIEDIRLLRYSNSGDTTGDRSRVVGYGAIGFFGENNQAIDSQKLVQIARESVESFVKDGKIPKFNGDGQLLKKKSGVFVTLRDGGELRGCIGIIETEQPLYLSIPQMAAAAAADPRFDPVTEKELSRLEYEVSVLSPMKRVKNVDEIKLGIHGVKIKNGRRSGVFLPQVAEETGWNKEEFLAFLCRDKAGLPADCWKDPATEVYTFTAEIYGDK
ncbi:MAG: AmmeMemoRadiSam system protein B [Candidatus Moranbacteria bacterium]|nr:AmmeMemoRadiSam system protein B [Candidatus Moranbacteria bacterium]